MDGYGSYRHDEPLPAAEHENGAGVGVPALLVELLELGEREQGHGGGGSSHV